MSTAALGLRILATSLPCGRLATVTVVLAQTSTISPCDGLLPLRTEVLPPPLWQEQLGQGGMKTQIFKDVWSSESLQTQWALVRWTLWLFESKWFVSVLQQNRKLALIHKSSQLGYLFSLLQIFAGKSNNYSRDSSHCVKEACLENTYALSHNWK